MKKTLLALLFVAGSSLCAQRYYEPPPPPRPYVYASQRPGPGYVFIDGYWDHNGRNYVWRAGYWARVPYAGARWVAPRYANRNFYHGYWRR